MSNKLFIQFIGTLGKDGVQIVSNEKSKFGKFFCAVNDTKTGKARWFDCLINASLAEKVTNEFKKGGKVYVTGKLSISDYKNAQGEMQVSFQVSVLDFVLQKNTQPEMSSVNTISTGGRNLDDLDDELPF